MKRKLAFLIVSLLLAAPARAADAPHRIVFLGDSITDGETYILLIRQALREANKPVPVCINAGVGGDTAAKMLERLERDVLPHRPTLVAMSVGVNDVLQKVPNDDSHRDVAAIADRFAEEKIPLLVLTTSILGEKHAEADKRLEDNNAFLRQLAEVREMRLADVNKLMAAARSGGASILDPDDVHPNFAGHRLIARALLDALGLADVNIPEKLKLEPLPGIIADWHILPIGDNDPALNGQSIHFTKPGPTWKPLRVPSDRAEETWWLEQERQRGFAVSLPKQVGAEKAKRFLGCATIDSDSARNVVFATGAQLQSIWLNRQLVYRSDGWAGWHAGRDRIGARLRKGTNLIIIETGDSFFLSITEK